MGLWACSWGVAVDPVILLKKEELAVEDGDDAADWLSKVLLLGLRLWLDARRALLSIFARPVGLSRTCEEESSTSCTVCSEGGLVLPASKLLMPVLCRLLLVVEIGRAHV